MPPGDFALVRIYYGASNRFPQQLDHYYVASGASIGSNAEALDLAEAISALVSAPFKACITGQAGFFGVSVASHVSGVVYHGNTTTDAGVGSALGDPAPAFVSACIRKSTATAGRTGIGRWFIGSVPEPFTVGDSFSAGALSAYQALGDSLVEGPVTSSGAYVAQLFSKKDNSFHVLTDTAADAGVKRQGRRFVRRLFV